MADKFFEWASEYFSPNSLRLDCLIKRDDALADFRTKYNMKDMTSNAFYRKMKAFCDYCSYTEEFNPDEYCAPSKPGHILRREKTPDGLLSAPVEWIYIRTNQEVLESILKSDKEASDRLEVISTIGTSPLDDRPF